MKILAAFLIVILAGCHDQLKNPVKTGLEGKMLPEVSLLLTDSITHIRTIDIPVGKPVVLFYFSPRCPYCRDQVAEIIAGMNILKDIRFYMITGFAPAEMKHFLEEYQLAKYTNIIVGCDSTNYLAYYFNVPGVPYMAIYGKDKKLKNAFIGKVFRKQIKDVAFR